MRYEFATAGRILVAPGCRAELADLVEAIGSRGMLVHGRGMAERGGPSAQLARQLIDRGLIAASYTIGGEPDIATIEHGAKLARELSAGVVIGLGGGSALDAAKAIAGLATNSGSVLDYIEVVGAGAPLERPALPVIAVPTTAGTGSEVTRNAVIAAPDQRVKASIRHGSLLPRLALVDSELTHDLPPAITASSGIDALTQLLEAYVSARAQPITDGICLEGLTRAGWALRQAYHQPGDAAAREAMATASLLSGLALANAGLGAVHGVAGPLGGAYPAPHGAAVAALLPHITAANVAALRQRDPHGPALARYTRAAEALLGQRAGEPGAQIDRLVAWLHQLVSELGIPSLSAYGLDEAGVPALAAQAARASSMRANPIVLEQHELEAAIRAALGSM